MKGLLRHLGWDRLRRRISLPVELAPLGVLLLAELFGRRSASLASDFCWSAAVCGALFFLTGARWGLGPGELWRRARGRFGFEWRLDLRREPGLERRLPPVLRSAVIGASASLVLAAALSPLLPGDVRRAVLTASPSLYFVAFAAVWAVAAALALTGVLACLVLVAEVVLSRIEVGVQLVFGTSLLAYAVFVLFAVSLLPAWLPIVVMALGSMTAWVALASGPDWGLDVLWRPIASRGKAEDEAARPVRSARSVGPGEVLAALAHSIGAVSLSMALVLSGELVWGGAEELDVPGQLGLGAVWCTTTAILAVAAVCVRVRWLRGYANPARSPRVRVAVVGELPVGRRELRSLFARRGFDCAFGDDGHRPADVPLRLVTPVLGARVARERWVLEGSLAGLEGDELPFRIGRRGTLRRRRELLQAMHRLWREARATCEPGTVGFWLAPHLWFVGALFAVGEGEESAEEDLDAGDEPDESATRSAGPWPYRERFSLAARAELHSVLAGASIDALFVERGVAGRSLRQIFQRLLEHHDLFGAGRPARARDFVGVPGVRVVVDELGLGPDGPVFDAPLWGRARILQVGRDGGRDLVPRAAPSDGLRVPLGTAPV